MDTCLNQVIMQNLVEQFKEEFRQMIREELAANIPISEPPKELIKPVSQKELCTFLGLTEPTVIRWRQKGKLPFMQIGSAIRYDLNAVLLALQAKNKKGASN